MRHHRKSIRFGRQRSHYKATLRALVLGLIINKSIRTTKVKAKEASRMADKLVTLGKDKSVINQRRAYSILRDRKLVAILFNDIAPLFKDRNGGYTRVMLINNRRGDNAEMAILEFTEKPKIEAPKKKMRAKKKEVLSSETKPKVEKEEVTPQEPKKEEVREKTQEVKREMLVKEEPKKPEKHIPKPGFFKRFFRRKQDK